MSLKTSFLLLIAAALFGAGASANPLQAVTLSIPKQENQSLLGFADLSLDYTVRSDLNQNVDPHTYSHSLGLSIAKEFWSRYTAFVTIGVEFTTLDSAIYRSTNKESYFSPRDISLGVSTDKNLGDRNKLSLSATQDFLNSDDSRYFGYRSVTGVGANINTRLWNWLSLRQSLDGSYILNRYRYAPVSAGKIRVGDINPDALASYSVGPVFTVLTGLKLSATMTLRGTHYLDGTSVNGFGNSYTMSYASGRWSTWVKYLNRGYAERGETNLWFADQYRRLVSGGLTFNF